MNEVSTKEKSKLEHADATGETFWVRGLWPFLNHTNTMVVQRSGLGTTETAFNQKCIYFYKHFLNRICTMYSDLIELSQLFADKAIPKAYNEG